MPPPYDHLDEAIRAAAQPEALRTNLFRLSGARVDETARTLNQRLSTLKIMVEMEQFPEHGFAGQRPDEGAVRQAIERAKDPVKRLADECLWFWPLELDQPDAALEAIAAGNQREPIAIWQQMCPHGTWGPIARHNLGLVAFLDASEKTSTFLRKARDAARPEAIGAAWIETANNLALLADSLAIEDFLRGRLRALDDPRLNVRAVTTVQLALPRAVGRQAALAALALHEADCYASKTVAFCADKLGGEEIPEFLAQHLRADLEHLQDFCRQPPTGDPRKLWREPAERLLGTHAKLELFQGGKVRANDLANACSRRLRGYAVECANEHDDYETSLAILKLLLPLVTGEELERIQKDLRTVTELLAKQRTEKEVDAPIRDFMGRLDKLHKAVLGDLKSKACGSVAVAALIAQGRAFLAEIEALKQGHAPAASADKARQRLAHVFRDISVEVNNKHQDYGAALLLCDFVLTFAPAQTRDNLLIGRATLLKNYDIAREEKHGPYSGTYLNTTEECLLRGLKFAAGGALLGGLVGQHIAGALLGGLVGALAGFFYRP